MSSRQALKELINERLTAAASEIFSAFELTINVYEQELGRLRKERNVERKPHNVPQQQDNKEEVVTDQHLCDEEWDHVEPESFHIKEDVDEIPISLEEEQLVLRQGTGTLTENNIFKAEEDVDYHQGASDVIWQPKIQLNKIERPPLHVSEKDDILRDHQLCQQQNQNHQKISISQSLSLKDRTIVLTSHHEERDHMETETDSEQQRLSPVAERQDQTEISLRDSGSLSETQITRPNYSHIGFNTHTEKRHKTQTTKKSLICKVCNKSIRWRNELLIHMRTHTGEKPFPCKTCGKCFSINKSLKDHMRIHTGEKPFICNICNKAFGWKTQLVSHMRTHTGEKPFICNICNKAFGWRTQLASHMRTHTGVKQIICNICNKSFRTKSYLVDHIRIHTGEKPFICNICNKSFRRKNEMVSHMKIHTDESSFSCKSCGKCFSFNSALKRHMRTQHRLENFHLQHL